MEPEKTDPEFPYVQSLGLPEKKPLSPEGEKALAHVRELPPEQQQGVVLRLMEAISGAHVGLRRPVQPLQYVVGTPPRTPVLRALKQELYDTVLVPESGLLGCRQRAFADCQWFPDHTPKTEVDCNLRHNGMLGYPLEYDLVAIELRVEKFCHADDVARLLRAVVLRWFFGQDTPWRRVAGSAMTPAFSLPGPAEQEAGLRAHVERQLKEFAARGAWLAYTADMRGPDGKPRRVSSTEGFSCAVDAERPTGELHGPARLKVVMQDTLYAQL